MKGSGTSQSRSRWRIHIPIITNCSLRGAAGATGLPHPTLRVLYAQHLQGGGTRCCLLETLGPVTSNGLFPPNEVLTNDACAPSCPLAEERALAVPLVMIIQATQLCSWNKGLGMTFPAAHRWQLETAPIQIAG